MNCFCVWYVLLWSQFVLILHFYANDNCFLISWGSWCRSSLPLGQFFPISIPVLFETNSLAYLYMIWIHLLVNILHEVLSSLDRIFLSFLLFWWIGINGISMDSCTLLETTEIVDKRWHFFPIMFSTPQPVSSYYQWMNLASQSCKTFPKLDGEFICCLMRRRSIHSSRKFLFVVFYWKAFLIIRFHFSLHMRYLFAVVKGKRKGYNHM